MVTPTVPKFRLWQWFAGSTVLAMLVLAGTSPSEAARAGGKSFASSGGRTITAKPLSGTFAARVGRYRPGNQQGDNSTGGSTGGGQTTKPPKDKDKPPVVVHRRPNRDWTEPTRHADPLCRGGKVVRNQCVCPTDTTLRHGHCVAVTNPPTGRHPIVVRPARPVLPPIAAAPLAVAPAFLPPKQPPSGLGGPAGSGGLPPVPPAVPPSLQSLAPFVADEMLVTIDRRSPQSLWRMIARSHGIALIEQTDIELAGARIVRCRIRDGRPVSAVITALQGDPRVVAAQPNYYYRFQQAGGPAAGALQYALAKLDMSAAHQLTQGRGAKVAVIDSGVDRTHPDLVAAVEREFDAVADGKSKVPSAIDSHGTAVAGIISGRGTVQGVAPAARLLSVRAFKVGAAGGSATATTMAILKGMDWAMGQGARVLNLSFAGPSDALLERAINAVVARRGIVVAAAGNNGPGAPPAYPAAYEPVIAVTATDADNRIYAKANRGAYIDLAAPGVDILVAAAGKSHQYQSGTSFAAAHVSGIIALMLELDPELDGAKVHSMLAAGAMGLGDTSRREEVGAGLINAATTVRLVAKR